MTDFVAQAIYAALPDTLFVALETSAGEPPQSAGYSRVRARKDEFRVEDSSLTNTGTFTFAVASAPWGTIARVAIYATATGGEPLISLEVGSERTVGRNDEPRITPRTIELSIGNLTGPRGQA